MNENKKLKNVKEVFKDYNSDSFEFNKALIDKINLHKKKEELEIVLLSDDEIKAIDLLKFEIYVEERFQIKSVDINIKRDSDIKVEEKNIEEDWNNIIVYVAHKHPMARALLKNSKIEITEKVLNVKLPTTGKSFLQANNFNEIISKVIYNIYGIKLKVDYTENCDNTKQKRQELIDNALLKEIENQMAHNGEIKKENADKESSQNKANKEETKTNTDLQVQEPAKKAEETPLIYGRNQKVTDQITKITDISVDSGNVTIVGKILNIKLDDKDDDINLGIKTRELKNGKFLVIFSVYDNTNTINCKAFVQPDKVGQMTKRLKNASKVKVIGTAQFDPYAKEIGILCNAIIEEQEEKVKERMDNSKVKRVELHMHTQMSTMDGVTPVKDLIKRAMKWGMKSIAITDHGSVQAFPDAHKMLGVNNPDMKVLYGVEAYLVPDKIPAVSNSKNQSIDTTYCVLDLETTGLSFRTEKITEIGIMKIKDGQIIDKFECFVNPEKPIPQRVVEVTNITDDMVKDAETIDKILPKVIEFVGDSVLVAHNADFDIGFLKYNAKQLGLVFENTYLDTLKLAKELFPDYKKYKLGPIDAINRTMVRTRGSYALALMFKDYPNQVFFAKNGSPLIVAKGSDSSFLASDVPAILKFTNKVYYVSDLECGYIKGNEIRFFDLNGDDITETKKIETIDWKADSTDLGNYSYYMEKEIDEQPKALRNTINAYVDKDGTLKFPEMGITKEYLNSLEEIYIFACGSAYHAGVVAEYLIEDLANVNVRVELASEFKYRHYKMNPKSLAIVISQSGETKDTHEIGRAHV